MNPTGKPCAAIEGLALEPALALRAEPASGLVAPRSDPGEEEPRIVAYYRVPGRGAFKFINEAERWHRVHGDLFPWEGA